MEYKTGEVAKLLNVSKEMIRYYEKSGAFRPTRKENNYRSYTMLDIFSLIEVIEYKEMGIKLKDIDDMVNENFNIKYIQKLNELINNLDKEIYKKQLLKQRIQLIIDRNELCKANVGNYWIEKAPARTLMLLQKAIGDEYDKIDLPIKMAQAVFSPNNIVFNDGTIFFKEDHDEWWLSFDQCYYDVLELPNLGKIKHLDTQYCLCTIVDVGDLGSFNRYCYKDLLKYMEQKGYKQNGEIYGLLLSRGYEKNQFSRMFQIFAPIQLNR